MPTGHKTPTQKLITNVLFKVFSASLIIEEQNVKAFRSCQRSTLCTHRNLHYASPEIASVFYTYSKKEMNSIKWTGIHPLLFHVKHIYNNTDDQANVYYKFIWQLYYICTSLEFSDVTATKHDFSLHSTCFCYKLLFQNTTRERDQSLAFVKVTQALRLLRVVTVRYSW